MTTRRTREQACAYVELHLPNAHMAMSSAERLLCVDQILDAFEQSGLESSGDWVVGKEECARIVHAVLIRNTKLPIEMTLIMPMVLLLLDWWGVNKEDSHGGLVDHCF